ncbi:hypothetical protein HFN89_00725 [Rhizobium laguerreae]|nr:hypothetical protein [Rhizobium laguerreae]
MAGTGHRYEISNPTAVTKFANHWRGTALARDLEEAHAWLCSKHFLKYLTGELFSFRLKPAHVINSVIPDEKSQHIVAKVVAGDEVRRFDPDLFETLGPDLAHILDWIAELKRTDDPLYKKVSRMETPVLAGRADAWTKRLNARSIAFDGISHPVLSASPELTWFELKDSRALSYEGSMMSHCVGGHDYARMVEAGQTRIFSLRTETQKPVLTAEIRNDDRGPSLVQIQKRGNGGLPIAYCDAAVSLLNAVAAQDLRGAARRYALVCEAGRWTTIFDAWAAINFMGRTAMSDGRSLMIMSATDAAAPLVVVEYALGSQSPERWFEGDFDPLLVRLKPAADTEPHYDDQLEACEIANHFAAGDIRAAQALGPPWMKLSKASSRLVPRVDTYERVEMPSGFFYKEKVDGTSPAECYLPHSADPSRLMMVATKTEYDIQATIVPGQRISHAETARCLDFLTATKARSIKKDGSGEAVNEFTRLCEPMLIAETLEWRSFLADRREVPARKTSGIWQETEYLLRYRPDRFGSIDIHVRDGTVTHLSGFCSGKDTLIEIVTKLRQKRLTSAKFLTLSSLGRKRGDATTIFMCDGKWVWSDCDRKFVTTAQLALEANARRPDSVSEAVLNGLLTHANAMLQRETLKVYGLVVDLKRRLLDAWFMRATSLENYPVRRRSIWATLDEGAHYPIIDRMIDLADQGFELDSRKSTSQFKKFLALLSGAYGRRVDIWVEVEFTEFLVRWYRHLPKKYMNMMSSYWLSCPVWLAKPDVAGRLLEILADERTWKTKFRDAVKSQAERTLDEADYASMDSRDLANHARLFHLIAKSRYLYGRKVETLGTLVGHLSSDPAQKDVPLDELREIHAKYAA